MSDAEPRKHGVSAEGIKPEDELVSRYEVVPYTERAHETDLYAFRASLPQPAPAQAPAPTPRQIALTGTKNIALIAGVGALAVLFSVLITMIVLKKQEPEQPFIDLGTNHIASAGLGGRLIAKWDGSAEYELHIDPLVPAQIGGFAAVAANPPRPISIDLHFKDMSGSVVCQKEILLPIDPAGQANPQQVQPLVPTKTAGGDIVQNVTASDGQIDEIVINGQLPCPAKSYKSLASWDFVSSFPLVAEQEDWMRHEQGIEAELRRRAAEARAKALIPNIRPLPAPIEGDDVIVFDNPSKGTVETKAGRVFFIGKDGLRGHAPGWQIFPATVHFRCDIKATCTLTRHDVPGFLQVRLVH